MNNLYQNGSEIGNENYYRNLFLKQAQKRSLRKSLTAICIMLVAAYVCVYGFALVYYTALGVASAVYSFSDKAIALLEKAADILFYIVQLVIPAAVFMLIRGRSVKSYLVIATDEAAEKTSFLRLLCFGGCAFAISCAMSGLSSVFTSFFGLSEAAFDVPAPANAAEFIIEIIAIAILPPILEEFVFRGLILGELMPYGKSFAIVASAVFFASAHGSAEQMIYSFAYGLLFAFIAVKTGSLKVGIIIHFLNNIYACTLDYIETFANPEIFELVSGIIYVVLIAAGLLSAVYLVGKNIIGISEKITNESIPGKLSNRETFAALVSPVMIVYYLFVLFETLSVYFMY